MSGTRKSQTAAPAAAGGGWSSGDPQERDLFDTFFALHGWHAIQTQTGCRPRKRLRRVAAGSCDSAVQGPDSAEAEDSPDGGDPAVTVLPSDAVPVLNWEKTINSKKPKFEAAAATNDATDLNHHGAEQVQKRQPRADSDISVCVQPISCNPVFAMHVRSTTFRDRKGGLVHNLDWSWHGRVVDARR